MCYSSTLAYRLKNETITHLTAVFTCFDHVIPWRSFSINKTIERYTQRRAKDGGLSNAKAVSEDHEHQVAF